MDNLLGKVKERLNILDNKDDKKIEGYIEDITSKIKSICNRMDFPEELNYLAINYAINCYIYYRNKDILSNEELRVTSASDNGQTVSFKIIETVSKDEVDLDKVIADNIAEISNYAYARW